MDPASITAGSVSIIHLCARNTISLARWTGTKQTTNEQIKVFCAEIRSLSATYDGLNNKLHAPRMASAVESLEKLSGGLWQHVALSIKDCENTMVTLNEILNKFSSDSAELYQQAYQLFGQSMGYGDMSRLRQLIPIFDMVLAFLLQLIITNKQLGQQFINAKQQAHLDARLKYLEERLTRIKTVIEVYSQSADTYIAANWTREDDARISKNLNGYISAARNFLINASAKTFERPRTMTIVPVMHSTGLAISPNSGDLLSDQVSPLDSWVWLPNNTSLSSQPLSEPRSPVDILSPNATMHGFLQGEEETEGEFGRGHEAPRME